MKEYSEYVVVPEDIYHHEVYMLLGQSTNMLFPINTIMKIGGRRQK